MKRFLLIAAALFAFIPSAFAQEDDGSVLEGNPLTLYTSPSGIFSVDIFSHIGFGAHIIRSDDFAPKPFSSYEFFLNVFKLTMYPLDFVGVEIGGDLEFNWVGSRENFFYTLDDRTIQVGKFVDIAGSSVDRQRGKVDIFGINFPAMLKFKFGNFRIGGGAQAMLNFNGGTQYEYRQGNKRTLVTYKGAEVNLFSYAFIGMISYYNIGFYFQYYPSKVNLFTDTPGTPKMGLMTAGIAFGF